MKNKIIIGKRETIDLVDYNIHGLSAKIDTGAYYGAIHCTDVKVVNEGKRDQLLSFVLLDPKHPQYNQQLILTQDFNQVNVRSSFGQNQRRYLVKLKVRFLEREYMTYFSLADRSKMVVPVLLGRYFLKGKFIVDVEGAPHRVK